MAKTTKTCKGATDRSTGARTGKRDISAIPDFGRISTKLTLLYSGPDKHRQTLTLWDATFKGLLSHSEIKRMWDAFSGDLNQLHALSPRILEWSKNANPDNWSKTWLENVFKKYDIQTVRKKRIKIGDFVYNETTGEFETPKEETQLPTEENHPVKEYVAPCNKPLDLKELPDNELVAIQVQIQQILDDRAELARKQAELARKKAAFFDALELAGISSEEALKFLGAI